MKATSVIVGVCGYVESAHNSKIVFCSSESYESRLVALHSLGTQLLSYHKTEMGRSGPQLCCKGAEGQYCSTCGRKIGKHNVIDLDDFRSMVNGYHSTTADDIGCIDEFGQWTAWCGLGEIVEAAAANEILYLSERFEQFITWSFGESADVEFGAQCKREIDKYQWTYGRVVPLIDFLEDDRFDAVGNGH